LRVTGPEPNVEEAEIIWNIAWRPDLWKCPRAVH